MLLPANKITISNVANTIFENKGNLKILQNNFKKESY